MVTLFLIIIFVLLVGFGIAFYFMYRHYEYQLKREIKRAQKSELLKSVAPAVIRYSVLSSI